jgi:crossover junction endodeoxyribonuclease RusA
MRRAGKVDANPIPFEVTVYGEPAPQGSKSFKGMRGGKAILAESSPKVKPWRIGVEWAAKEAIGDRQTPIFDCPVEVWICFYFYKPSSSPKRRQYPDTKPDIDKLLRSTFDALTNAGVLRDDSRVVRVHTSKLFCDCDESALSVPGAQIRVEAI